MGRGYTIGIDLGTTNSAISIVTAGEPEIIPNNVGERTTQSVVAIDESGPVVGTPAVNQQSIYPERTVKHIKRHMGDNEYTVTIEDTEYTPAEISAFILKQLIKDAEDYLGGEVTDAVITVPAYFGSRERQATKTAGEIAGINVSHILNEPTAAALAYGLSQENNQVTNALIYDLGGGTFDVSIIEISDSVIEVLATGGNNALGGQDWDSRVISWIVETYQQETGVDVSNDREAMERVRTNAIEAKHMLSNKKQTSVMIPYLSDEGNFNEVLTKDMFDNMTEDLLFETVETCKNVIHQANMTANQIEQVLLVGGSTRMSQVQRMSQDVFGAKVSKEINPDECVAIGAALKASMIANERTESGGDEQTPLDDELILIDIIPKTIGVQLADGTMDPVVERNEKVPTTVEKQGYTTAEDNQSQVNVRVFEGEQPIAEQNKLLNEFYLKGIPQAPAGEPNLGIRFHLTGNGILEVRAFDTDSGISEQLTIEGVLDTTQDEIERLKTEHPEIQS